jgi:hypothetical protein
LSSKHRQPSIYTKHPINHSICVIKISNDLQNHLGKRSHERGKRYLKDKEEEEGEEAEAGAVFKVKVAGPPR